MAFDAITATFGTPHYLDWLGDASRVVLIAGEESIEPARVVIGGISIDDDDSILGDTETRLKVERRTIEFEHVGSVNIYTQVVIDGDITRPWSVERARDADDSGMATLELMRRHVARQRRAGRHGTNA